MLYDTVVPEPLLLACDAFTVVINRDMHAEHNLHASGLLELCLKDCKSVKNRYHSSAWSLLV